MGVLTKSMPAEHILTSRSSSRSEPFYFQTKTIGIKQLLSLGTFFHFSAKTQMIKQTIVTKLTLRSALRVPHGRGAAKRSIDPLLSVALVQ
jgi:hypothetical protein